MFGVKRRGAYEKGRCFHSVSKNFRELILYSEWPGQKFKVWCGLGLNVELLRSVRRGRSKEAQELDHLR